MDDNNVHARGIPDELMREALEKASLRLAISPELRDAYEQKYSHEVLVVPRCVDPATVNSCPMRPWVRWAEERVGALIGSYVEPNLAENAAPDDQASGLADPLVRQF